MRQRQRESASPWPRDWLRRPDGARQRPSALERQLLEPRDEEALLDELQAQAADLAARLAELERRLGASLPPVPPPGPRRTVELRRGADDCDLGLRRCEGFAVDTPLGELGVVEGVRYASSTERPDELEVRVGRVWSQVVLVPVADVEQVSLDDECVRLRRDPRPHRPFASRARQKLHLLHS